MHHINATAGYASTDGPHRGFELSRWFAAIALACIACISVASGYLLVRFLTERLLQEEARLTQEFVDSLVKIENLTEFFAGDLRPGERSRDFFEHVSHLPGVFRVNVFSTERTLLWSSDLASAGDPLRDQAGLEAALRGRTHARAGERDVIEIYVPLRHPVRNDIMGVVELYKAPDALAAAIAAARRAVWAGAGIAALFLYVSLFGLVRRADRVIRAQRERLVRSETMAAIGELSAAVAHGIRNPLATIRSAAELALDCESAECRKEAAEIVQQVDRLDAWVRELISYSQPMVEALQPTDVAAVLRASLEDFRRELARRRIEAHARLETPLPAAAADAAMLRQLFSSLIVNAIDAVGNDGRITLSAQCEPARRLAVRIEDSGVGMSREQLASAFKPFHTTKAKGLGIGLPLARRIVERFGGSISMASEPGDGTTVVVVLPIA